MLKQLHLLIFSVILSLTACSSVELKTESQKAIETTAFDSKQSELPTHRSRILLIGLDGIGFDLFRRLQNGGHFREFNPVAPMVATFPSISDPNWAHLLHVQVEKSYTKEFFDREFKNPKGGFGRVTGGLIDQAQSPAQYEKVFDFKPEGFVEHLASLAWSVTSAHYWLEALERDFFKFDPNKDFLAFILNTDMIAHTKGESETLAFMGLLEERIKKIRSRYKQERNQDLEVILVSDHGNSFLSPHPIFPTEDLEKKNWKIVESIDQDNQVAFVFPEILSFGAMYCRDTSRQKLARDISTVDGVHSAFYLSAPNTVLVESQSGTTRIKIDLDKKTVRYEILKGKDPFEQIQLFKKNRELSFKDYFDATVDSTYPNALVRAWEAFHTNSVQPASVLVNPNVGYVFANRTLHLLTKFFGLKSVHGSMHRDDSLGIVVSTHRNFSATPPQEFLNQLNLRR